MRQQGPRIMHKIANAIGSKELSTESIERIIDDFNLDNDGLGRTLGPIILEMGSMRGRKLNEFRLIMRNLGELSDNALEGLGLERLRVTPSPFERFNSAAARPVVDIWRASLTAMPVTASRNLGSAMVRNPMLAFEHVLADAVQGTGNAIGGRMSTKEAWEAFGTLYAQFSPTQRARLQELMPKTLQKEMRKLFSTPATEVSGKGGAIVRWLQVFNRTQEMFARRITFAHDFGWRLRRMGLGDKSLDDLIKGWDQAPEDLQRRVTQAFHDSVLESLDITFARGAEDMGKIAQKVLGLWQALPPLALVHPFPRFMANSMRFLMERTAIWRAMGLVAPTGRRRVARGSVLKEQLPKIEKRLGELESELARAQGTQKGEISKNITKLHKRRAELESQATQAGLEIARAAEGVLFLGAGLALRMSPLAGPKWYQLKLGTDEQGKQTYFDMRPFSPITTFAFLGEMIRTAADQGLAYTKRLLGDQDADAMRQSGIEPEDFFEALLGIRRLTGSGLFILDAFTAKDMRGTGERVQRFLQTVLGGFATPVRPLKDLISTMKPEEGVWRDVRVKPQIGGREAPNLPFGAEKMLNEFMSNIPALGTHALPARGTPTREEGFGTEKVAGLPTGLFRQLTGVTLLTSTPLEQEVDRLKLRSLAYTGLPNLDRELNDLVGNAIETAPVDETIMSQQYQALPDEQKKELIRKTFTQLRTRAKQRLVQRQAPRIIEEAVEMLRALRPSARQTKLESLQIPQGMKLAIARRLRLRLY
jgi:hypothetical protein